MTPPSAMTDMTKLTQKSRLQKLRNERVKTGSDWSPNEGYFPQKLKKKGSVLAPEK